MESQSIRHDRASISLNQTVILSTNCVQGAVLGTGVAKRHQKDMIPAQVLVAETNAKTDNRVTKYDHFS